MLGVLPTVKMPENGTDEDITALTCDSRHACAGGLFIALRGAAHDGHAYAHAAYARGCRAFLCEYPPRLPADAAVAYVPDCRRAMAALAAKFYGYPARRLTMIALTGTKGKTTTAWMICHLLSAVGVSVGYIGSGGIRYGGVVLQTENTTPSALELHRVLDDMCRAHVRVVVLEVSSQALISDRVAGLEFSICMFTNLAPDHIGDGEHPDFAHYREAKARLFSDYGCQTVILNADDPAAAYMLAASTAGHVYTVSCNRADATLSASRIRLVRQEGVYGTAFLLRDAGEGEIPVSLSLPGECNVSNALLALCAARVCLASCLPLGPLPLRMLAPHLQELHIPGRFEVVKTVQHGVDYLIDYAHNGYSLRAALTALRAYSPARLVCLFGSVGARTYSRRTELGQAACLADLCIVTTDDPGTEPPEDTMREICRVLEEAGKEYVAIPDREAAIRYAVAHAQPGDLVLLAGKGHETHQLIGEERQPFSERAILLAATQEAVAIL